MPRKRKQYLWLPYLSQINFKEKSVEFIYKGGREEIQWTKIHSIMIYGNSIDLPVEFLEKCAFYKIPVVFHRRNLPRAVFISPTLPPDQEDLLTKQITYRENEKKRNHIAKKLLQAKFKGMNWLLPIRRDLLYRKVHLEDMIEVEAWHAKRYWKEYYRLLNIKSDRRDDDKDIAETCLDAVSKFISGIFLRWILYHNLSPFHGFLHKPTDYPALVYDLMEPYRGYFDKVVFEAVKEIKDKKLSTTGFVGKVINRIKKLLDTEVYVHSTRQIVDFHELFHGIVLALRSYLLGNSSRFIVPMPSKPKGGRPIKAGFELYGHRAGKTDFWEKARKVAKIFS